MKDKLNQALTRIFDRHRIVFWYDEKKELRKEFDSIDLPQVEKVEITNNEFTLKHRLLREEPSQQFLLYHEGAQPEDVDNWLLDVQMSQGEFRADQGALWLTELGLPFEFVALVDEHIEFFKAVKRREGLRKLLKPDDTERQIRRKMLAVCAASEPRIDSVLESLLAEAAEPKEESIRLIERCQLGEFLWELLERYYGYVSESPGVKDFLIELFKSCYARATDGEIKLTEEALVFLRRWKDSRTHEAAFEGLSDECSEILSIPDDLVNRDLRDIVEIDYFRIIDNKILSDLVREVKARTISSGECTRLIRQRRAGHWYENYRNEYEATHYAALFIDALNKVKLSIESMEDGASRYTESWYEIDSLYRRFTFHYRKATHVTLLKDLADEINLLYSNRFLLALGDLWQAAVDQSESWNLQKRQAHFFRNMVQTKFLDKSNKVFVVISDGMRYEVGHELAARIRSEDRFSAKLDYMVTGLPSYTQLGMASLLPNSELQITLNKSATVKVDGTSSAGTDKRAEILSKISGSKGTAVRATDLLGMNNEQCRELVREHDVVYVFQNHIDKVGDSRDTEQKVFEAVEQTIDELTRLVKKLTSANANNILITADHGFIYQDAVEESEFLSEDANKVEAEYRDRRFLLGKNLPVTSGFKHFTAQQAGLSGDTEMLIPNSINRLRLSGSGSRYVHGGASLQEILVPVIEVNKSRKSDVAQVDIDVIRGSTSTISTGQLGVALYQVDPVSEKQQQRTLRIGIYSDTGELISDAQELPFDMTSESARERELTVRLVLSHEADNYNNQQVHLRLEEPVAGTSHFREYRSFAYTLRRSFTSDFDDF
jgi:uncharacterized protein (TIGR02687 family)